MKIKNKELKFLEYIESNDFNFPFEKDDIWNDSELKKSKIKKKNKLKEKESKQETKKLTKIQRDDLKRIKKCNEYLLVENLENREIYETIDHYNTNGKKTIVYFVDVFYPVIDGVVTVVDNYANLMKEKFNVVICAPKHKNKPYKTDKYLVLNTDSLFIKKQGYDLGFPQIDINFQKFISLLKIDIVHVHSPFTMGVFGVALAKKRGVPSFATFHSQLKQNFENAVKSDFIATLMTNVVMTVYQKAETVVTMNKFSIGVLKSYGLKKDVEIVPNATNLKPVKISDEKENLILEKYKINKNIFNIIFIGRFVEVKNVYFILRVLKELSKTTKNFNFTFIGYGPEEKKMQSFIEENNLSDCVKITGKVDKVEEKSVLIKNSDLMFFPSVYDTDGIVRIECACFGVPTLCIENTGAASCIENNVNGFVERNNEKEFVKKLKYLIENPDIVKKVGEDAKKTLYVTWKDVGEKLEELYNKKCKNCKKDQ